MSDSKDSQMILQQAITGRQSAFGDLVERFRPLMFNRVSQRIGSLEQPRFDAADVVQQVSMLACKEFQNFRGKTLDEFIVWLLTICDNAVIDLQRYHQRQKRSPQREQEVSSVGALPDKQAVTPSLNLKEQEQRQRIEAEIDKLQEDQRAAVRLKFLESMALAEISEVLGKTDGAVAGLIKRGLSTLRNNLRDESFFK